MKARVTYTNRAVGRYSASAASDYILGSVGDNGNDDNDEALVGLDEDKKNKYYIRMKWLGGVVVFVIVMSFFCHSILFTSPVDNSIQDTIKTNINSFSHSISNAVSHDVSEEVDTTTTISDPDKIELSLSSPVAAVSDPKVALADLLKQCNDKISEIRTMKSKGVVIETSSEAKGRISLLQPLLRNYITSKYGSEPYFVEMTLKFPESMPDAEGSVKKIHIKLAPIRLVPYSVFYFLQMVEGFRSGAFHRWAGHVLQAMASVDGLEGGLAWQEYSADFPHITHTLGYAGRPGGPAFYISTVDNTKNHGPASQGSKTEADGAFGSIYKGFSVGRARPNCLLYLVHSLTCPHIVDRMKKQPGKSPPSGFVNSPLNFIKIESLKLVRQEDI